MNWIHQCQVCNTQKPSRQLPAGLFQSLPIPQHPWSHIAIDFVTDLPNSNGHTMILTVIDRFSKTCRLIPLPKLPTALETTEQLCNLVFCFYGLLEDIVSDGGPQFTSRLWAAFFKALKVNVSIRGIHRIVGHDSILIPSDTIYADTSTNYMIRFDTGVYRSIYRYYHIIYLS